ncbi:hypothetical protein [Herbiconiux sp. A18JL235]|uniref:Uncharacterized protein n=1 Tax=Herbiconiux sp. A18JL235 TaxID=3152363 RepID=A0AB39BF27_9MICO
MSSSRLRRAASSAGVALLAMLLSVALTGCVDGRTDARAAQLVDELRALPHVVSASGGAGGQYDLVLSVTVQVETEVTEVQLDELRRRVVARLDDSPWNDIDVGFELGDGDGFSNLGGDATFAVFAEMWRDPGSTAVQARGAEGHSIYDVTRGDLVAAGGPAGLLAATRRMVSAAETAGGVQENLTFGAYTDDRWFSVERSYVDPVDDAVALWQSLDGVAPLLGAAARATEYSGQSLELDVVDQVAADELERWLEGHPHDAVEVDIEIVPPAE